ncbi:MAG: DUF512 domain-containing protein [Anaerolineae bacterium]|nr:DUF512 domain-containing protein [Anaerolineae bacterium]
MVSSSEDPRPPSGGIIDSVEPGSVGAQAQLRPGDRLLAIDGHSLRDVIDVQFYGAEEVLELLVERDGKRHTVLVEREYGQDLGLTFMNPTFDVDVRRCVNNCDFCFVKQNPRGMRRSLYVKDDDYRHAFLFGNFVTLTNLTEADWTRLEEQRLSPLYVSVHATDPDLRRRFLQCPAAPNVMDQLRRLAALGIEIHTQVVLVPGLNDGEHLARTIQDLADLHGDPEHPRAVASVGVVPIGLTKYHRGRCRAYTPEEARDLLDRIEAWQAGFRDKWGEGFVYAADEWYLTAEPEYPSGGRDVPPADAYDDFAQIENGVGMVRQLLDEWEELKGDGGRGIGGGELPRNVTLVCGTLIAPVLERVVGELNDLTGAGWQVVPVVNEFFGPVTTVSGLLTAQDVIATLERRSRLSCQETRFLPPSTLGYSRAPTVILPRSMFTGRYGAGSAPPDTTLDDVHVDEIGARLGVRVVIAGTMGEALEQVRRIA